jgi:hypothetical protein
VGGGDVAHVDTAQPTSGQPGMSRASSLWTTSGHLKGDDLRPNVPDDLAPGTSQAARSCARWRLMDRRSLRVIVFVLVIALALVLVWNRLRSRSDDLPDHPGAARPAASGSAGRAANSPPGEAASGSARRALSPDRRRAILAAIEAARDHRQAGSARRPAAPGSSPTSGPASGPASGPTSGSGSATVLDIINRTGDDSSWAKRSLATLNTLLGECYDQARAEHPELAGTLTLMFTIAGEPDVGGLLKQVQIIEDRSTLTQPALRECMQESLYALELDPPPVGIEVARELSLQFP